MGRDDLTCCVIHEAFVKKYPDRAKAPQRCVWEDDLRAARVQVAYRPREPKWLEREDPTAYDKIQSLRRHVLKGDEHAIRSCAQHGVDLNRPFPDGGGPALVEIASTGNMPLTRTLLELKANPACGNAKGYSPLLAAIDHDHWEVAGVLLACLKPSDYQAPVQTKSKHDAIRAAVQRRNAAETKRQELARIILRGEIEPHLIKAVAEKLEEAKRERERASLFLEEITLRLAIYHRDRFDMIASKKATTPKKEKEVKIEGGDSVKPEGSPRKSSPAPEGRWWLKLPKGDRTIRMERPR
eukprot:gnl/MRDRNA2_/MRDRNA2_88604_c0_seq1.p1 gnl/MRDRNA2_/MRDRNA2_88604_c0~~gnl/MRDRNA2_/MRDRNA2_88604_c0_seq1.p1  ORF type:complete len:297 (+),score=57.17 gnl/MRDRNA2_/MRDRNA2_88604_c0_seq1:156-1046(+)